MITNVLLSRFMTPFQVIVPIPKGRKPRQHVDKEAGKINRIYEQPKYLNVNLSHELWKDINISILKINYDDPPAFVYLFRLLWRWIGFNALVFCFLHFASKHIFGEAQLPEKLIASQQQAM